MPLSTRLRTRSKPNCQRLLTVGFKACGGVLEVLEGRVRLEGLSESLRALGTDAVAEEAASEGAFRVSAAADSRKFEHARHT